MMRMALLIGSLLSLAPGLSRHAFGQAGPVLQAARLHQGVITAAAYSPDGQHLGVATRIGIWLYRELTFAPVRLLGEGVAMEGLAFSGDGRRIAGYSGSSVYIWSVATGQLIADASIPVRRIHDLAFSPPDDTLLAAGGFDGFVGWIDIGTGDLTRLPNESDSIVQAVAFSPDGRLLASGGNDDTIRLWDVDSRSEVGRFAGHTSTIRALAIDPAGELLASGGNEGTRLWSLAEREQVVFLESSEIRALAFDPSGRSLAAAGFGETIWDGVVRIWDRERLELIATSDYDSPIWCVSFRPDGARLVAHGRGLSGSDAYVWDGQEGGEIASINRDGQHDPLVLEAISPDGRLLATHDDQRTPGGKTIELWDSGRRQAVNVLEGHSEEVIFASFGEDGRALYSGSRDKTLRRWDVSSGAGEVALDFADSDLLEYVAHISLSPDKRMAAVVSNNADDFDPASRMDIYDLAAQQRIYSALAAGFAARPVFSPDGRLVVLPRDGGGLLFDTRDRREVGVLEGAIAPYLFSPDSRRLVAAHPSMSSRDSGESITNLSVWDVASFKQVAVWEAARANSRIRDLAFSPDGATLATFIYKRSESGEDATKIWNLADGRLVAAMEGENFGGQFSPDGRTLAIRGRGGVRLWDTGRRELTAELGGHGGPVYKLLYSRDGQTLVTGSGDNELRDDEDGTVLVWRSTPTAVVAAPGSERGATLPLQTRLLPAFPNPFNREANLPFILAQGGAFSVEIYSAGGQKVRELNFGHRPAGTYGGAAGAVRWDGRNAVGELCAAGVYIYRLKTDRSSHFGRLVFVK